MAVRVLCHDLEAAAIATGLGHDSGIMSAVPGVGPVVALTYRATVDVPARFRSSKAVGAVFGLTPAQHQSGESDRPGGISKCGDEMMRVMLYEAAQIFPAENSAPYEAYRAPNTGRRLMVVAI